MPIVRRPTAYCRNAMSFEGQVMRKTHADVAQFPVALRRAAFGVLLLFAAGAAFAQEWPARPIRIVHGFTGGGPVDIISRLIAADFSERLGQPTIVEGKPGAGGTVGAAYVAKAEPDGYTLMLLASGHSAAPGLHKSLPYNATDDFTMISMLASSPFAIVTSPGSRFENLQDLVRAARSEPGRDRLRHRRSRHRHAPRRRAHAGTRRNPDEPHPLQRRQRDQPRAVHG